MEGLTEKNKREMTVQMGREVGEMAGVERENKCKI